MSITQQKQQLVLFTDNSVLSKDLLNDQKYRPFVSLLTYKRGTNNNWMMNVLMEQLLYDKNRINASSSGISSSTSSGSRNVVLISFTNGLEYYEYFFKKNTLNDLKTDGSSVGNFHFIDCFNGLFTDLLISNTRGRDASVYSTSYEAIKEKLFEGYILQKLNYISNTSSAENTTIFIDGLDMLLAATEITAVELVKLVNKLNKSQRRVFISLNSDDTLIDLSGDSIGHSYSLKNKTSEFYSILYHRSVFTISVKPLDTGRADDVTGTVRISKGMVPLRDLRIGDSSKEKLDVLENEYMFNVRKDSGISLFYS